LRSLYRALGLAPRTAVVFEGTLDAVLGSPRRMSDARWTSRAGFELDDTAALVAETIERADCR
jgi:hypothetical protein